jgi:hypothetical protein
VGLIEAGCTTYRSQPSPSRAGGRFSEVAPWAVISVATQRLRFVENESSDTDLTATSRPKHGSWAL